MITQEKGRDFLPCLFYRYVNPSEKFQRDFYFNKTKKKKQKQKCPNELGKEGI